MEIDAHEYPDPDSDGSGLGTPQYLVRLAVPVGPFRFERDVTLR